MGDICSNKEEVNFVIQTCYVDFGMSSITLLYSLYYLASKIRKLYYKKFHALMLVALLLLVSIDFSNQSVKLQLMNKCRDN